MSDEVWHYGNSAGLAAIAGWLLKHVFSQGRVAGQIAAMQRELANVRRELAALNNNVVKLAMKGGR